MKWLLAAAAAGAGLVLFSGGKRAAAPRPPPEGQDPAKRLEDTEALPPTRELPEEELAMLRNFTWKAPPRRNPRGRI